MIKSTVIWGGAVSLALVSAVAAYGNIARRTNNPPVATFPVSNGYSIGRAAELELRKNLDPVTGKIKPGSARRIETLSREALSLEPTNAAALRNLAYVEASRGKSGKATRLIRFAAQLTNRDPLTHSYLIRDYGVQNNLKGVLRQYDIAMRTQPATRDAFMGTLVQALQYKESVAPLAGMLRAGPPWSDAFWVTALEYRPGLVNLAELRGRLADIRDAGQDARDQLLLTRLAQDGAFDPAERLVQRLDAANRTAAADTSRNLLRNASFTAEAKLLPFDWELISRGGFSGYISKSDNALIVEVADTLGGVAARQLVKLNPGQSYRLQAQASARGAEWRAAPWIQLRCAERGDAPPIKRSQTSEAKLDTVFTATEADCEHYWLEVEGSPATYGSPHEFAIESISVTPTRSIPQAPKTASAAE